MISDLQGRLDELVTKHGIVGAGVAVYAEGAVQEAASGRADIRLTAPMTPRHVCLVGSTAKVLTATLVLQLVDEGRLDLDAPVRSCLPDLRVAGDATVAQLLSHTSGLGIGPYADHSRGADAVRRYVDALGAEQVVCGPGERWGYSNAGLVIAGRVVEVLRDTDWDTALRRHLLGPAAMAESATLPEEVLLHPVAVPHVSGGAGVRVAPAWAIAGRAMGPTGSSLATTAGDLVRFAAIHLNGGVATDGTRVLSEAAVKLMAEPRVRTTSGSPFAEEWALGWYASQWGDVRMRGHSGHNSGAGSHLAVFPDHASALALVFNSVPGDAGLHHELFTELAAEVCGAVKPPPWSRVTPLAEASVAAYAGRYACSDFTLDVTAAGTELEVTVTGLAELPSAPRRMRPVLGGAAWGTGQLGAHAAVAPAGHLTPDLFFSEPDDAGRPRFAHLSVFVARRTSDLPGES